MTNNIKLILAAVSALFVSTQASAYCGPPPDMNMPAPIIAVANPEMAKGMASPQAYFNTQMWKTCWASVEAVAITGQALLDFEGLKTKFQDDYHTVLLAQIRKASEQRITAYNGSTQAIFQTLNENYAYLMDARAKMETKMLETELDYSRKLQEDKINEKNQGFFSDGNGKAGIIQADSQSYQFFKSICKRNKMFNKTAGSVYQEQRNISVNKEIMQKTKQMASVTSNTNEIAQAAVERHSSLFCSAEDIKYNQCANADLKLCVEDDVESGICKISTGEIFELTNKDTDAVNFLSPAGFDGKVTYKGEVIEEPKNRIEDELFDVKYTYDEDQKAAADAFAHNLIFQPSVKAPTIDERGSSESKDFVNQYNKYLANLNLAHYSFQYAIASRKPITEGEIKMSEKDVLRYIIHNLQDPDTNAATMAAKDKGKDLMIYQLMSVNNKLKLENIGQKERIESLLAAILANTSNDPDLIKNLNSLK